MRITILTQYFPPETGAPQNRLFSLAGHLQAEGNEVHVLTAMPNYPQMIIAEGYKGAFYRTEILDNIQVTRSWIYVTTSKSILPRLLNYFSFVISSFFAGLFARRKADLIICESPPLFLGITAVALKWIKRSKLVMNISDLWPESAEKLGLVKNKMMLDLSYSLEAWLYRKSALVSCQTKGIASNITHRFPTIKTHWLPNGIDFNQFNLNASGVPFREKLKLKKSDFVLLYAGIIGHAQGLEVILHAASKLKIHHNIHFVLVGDGPVKPALEQLNSHLRLSNVHFVGNVPRDQMSEVVAACDAYIVPLKKSDLFLGAVPSKLFEPLALQKPILLGVDGEARELFIEAAKAGLFFEPENFEELSKQITVLFNNEDLRKEMGKSGLDFISKKFNRETIALDFNSKLIELCSIEK